MKFDLHCDLQWGIDPLNLPTQILCETWVQASLIQPPKTLELTVRVVSLQESQTLNNDYRGKNKPTNVLSFESDLPELEGITPYLGDLVVCAEVVEQEALQQNKSLEAHWAHMIVHGVLHLQGYDHIESLDAQSMEALEVKIMDKLGYASPYEISD